MRRPVCSCRTFSSQSQCGMQPSYQLPRCPLRFGLGKEQPRYDARYHCVHYSAIKLKGMCKVSVLQIF